MKKAPLVLAVSLAINVALVALYVTRDPVAVSPAAPVPARPAGTAAPKAAAKPAVSPSATKPASLADARDLVDRMRAAGFPANMIAIAAQSRLTEQYFARISEIMGLNEAVPPFWSSQASTNYLFTDPARMAAILALSRELTDAMKELVGPDYQTAAMTDEAKASFAHQYGDLPAEKITQIQQVMQDFALKQQEASGPVTNGYLIRLPEDTAQLAQLEQDRRAAIVALLTPQELEDYDLRSSNAALTLKNQLIAFEPSEDEYRTLFKLQQAFDEKYPSMFLAGASQDLMRERSQAQQKLRDDMIAALSPARADDYRLATENGANTVARIVNRLDLPMSTVGQLVIVQREIQSQANALRADRGISVDVRDQALAALQQQATERIAGKIGANGLAAYRSAAGSWIQNLLPPTPVPRGGPVNPGR